jgi:hypothetical protein
VVVLVTKKGMKMSEIIITNQKEWDELDKNFKEPTNVVFQDALIDKLIERYCNCNITLTGSSRIGSMRGSSRVGHMCDSSSVGYMRDSSSVGHMYASSRVGSMCDSSSIGSMGDSSSIGYMHDSSRVGYMCDSSSVGSMYASSSVGSMRASSRVSHMYASSSVGSMRASSRVSHMYASSRVGPMCDSSSIGSMGDSSSIGYMHDSSRVGYMCDSSSVGSMYASSSVGSMRASSRVSHMYASSRVGPMCDSSRIERAFDGVVIYTNDSNRVGFFDTGVSVKKIGVQSSFETMLEQGILRADGITKAIKKVKQITESEKVYFLEDETFCAQNGDTFAHAKTLKMSLFDLRFKLSDRDMSDYEDLSLDDKLSLEDAVTCYRVITGACSGGIEDFLERESINKNEFTIGEIIELTKDAYAGDTFAKFFKGE